MKSILFVFLVVLLTACSSLDKAKHEHVDYLTLGSNSHSYILEGYEIDKGNSSVLFERLERSGLKRLLMQDFKMGDLLEIGPELRERGYEMFYFNKKNEPVRINAM